MAQGIVHVPEIYPLLALSDDSVNTPKRHKICPRPPLTVPASTRRKLSEKNSKEILLILPKDVSTHLVPS